MVFKVSIVIDRPVEVVVAALMDPDNHPYWTTDLERFEVAERRPGEVGSIGRLHYSQKGRSYVMEDKLLYCEPDKKYVSQVSGDAISAVVETVLESSEAGTRMSITWSGRGKTLVLRVLLPFLRGKMVRQSQAELARFKELVETRGAHFGGQPDNDIQRRDT